MNLLLVSQVSYKFLKGRILALSFFLFISPPTTHLSQCIHQRNHSANVGRLTDWNQRKFLCVFLISGEHWFYASKSKKKWKLTYRCSLYLLKCTLHELELKPMLLEVNFLVGVHSKSCQFVHPTVLLWAYYLQYFLGPEGMAVTNQTKSMLS